MMFRGWVGVVVGVAGDDFTSFQSSVSTVTTTVGYTNATTHCDVNMDSVDVKLTCQLFMK